MELEPEYFDDGSSFFSIDPQLLNPESLGNFGLFERFALKDGTYRFRCLIADTRTMPKEHLMKLLRTWDEVYLHKKQNRNYSDYVKENLGFILNHDEIDIKKKTDTLVEHSTEVIHESFSANFGSPTDVRIAVKKVQSFVEKVVGFITSIDSLKGAVELIGHDYETHTHSIKVGWLMATFINANRDLFEFESEAQRKEFIIQAAVAGFLHDIGKIKIPSNVINKKGKLNNLEYVIMQSHTAYSVSLLFESSLSKSAMQTILYHHENEDGSGYPSGFGGDQIPLLAKICHVVDVFDALTSKRAYKEAKTPFEALKIMAGDNPHVESLKKFEQEARENIQVPVKTIVRDNYEAKLRRLREREMLEEEAMKRTEARLKLRDVGMSHCFSRDILRRFILTINKSESFDLSGLL